MRKVFNILSLFLLVFISACTVGPSYERPFVPDAALKPFFSGALSVDAKANLPDDWWRLYQDPILDDLISKAFAANTDLRVAKANLEQARAVLDEYQSHGLVSTKLTASTGYGNTTQLDPTGSTDVQWAASAGLSLSWQSDLFGRVENAIKASKADFQAVEAAKDAVRVTVAANTAKAYCDACCWAMALNIAKKSLEITKKSLDLVTQKEQAGSANMLDVERAATAMENARAKLAPLNARHKIALFELAALLGQTPGKLPEKVILAQVPPEPVADLPVGDGQKLLCNRPDLRQAERRLAAATAKIGVATADLYPSITLGAKAGYFHNDYIKGHDSFTWSLGPVPMLSWNFPNTTLARAKILQAKADGKAALAAFDGKVLTALKEVEQALMNLGAEQDRLNALEKAENRAKKAWYIARLRYDQGSASFLEALTAQKDYLDARTGCALSVQRLSAARVDLFRALGCGWKEKKKSHARGYVFLGGNQLIGY